LADETVIHIQDADVHTREPRNVLGARLPLSSALAKNRMSIGKMKTQSNTPGDQCPSAVITRAMPV
jgi:hypothetical protein